jgi:hypothetical protein
VDEGLTSSKELLLLAANVACELGKVDHFAVCTSRQMVNVLLSVANLPSHPIGAPRFLFPAHCRCFLLCIYDNRKSIKCAGQSMSILEKERRYDQRQSDRENCH